MRIVFDTNIWISFLIGKRLSILKTLLLNPKIEVWFCAELEQEFLDVAHRSKIRKYVDEKHINRVHKLMTDCEHCEITKREKISIRDAKDIFLLELAENVGADYLVTGDTDLLSIRQYGNTFIINFETVLTII